MRVDALIPLPQSAEYWDFTTTQADSGEVVQTYFKSADIKVMITETNGLPLVFSREKLRFNGQLRNVTDPLGASVIDASRGGFYFLGAPIAQFDVFGNVMGYKYTITARYTDE